ncbi:MAG: hypothetical protein WCA35_14610 [Kovacikia sp.]
MGSANIEVADRRPASPTNLAILAEFQAIARCCQQSEIGKLLPNALYVHASALASLDPLLQQYEQSVRPWLRSASFTLVKFQLNQPKVSYLLYPHFVSPRSIEQSSALHPNVASSFTHASMAAITLDALR